MSTHDRVTINQLPDLRGKVATIDNVLDAAAELGKIPAAELALADVFSLSIIYASIRGMAERHRIAAR